MPDLLGHLLPFAVLGILAPVPAAIVVTLLMTRGGLPKAVGYVGSATAVYLVVGALALLLPLDRLGSTASVVGGALLIVLGLGLWWLTVVQYRRAVRGVGPTASYLDRLEALSLRTVLLWGLLVTVLNVKQFALYLVGVSAIVRADVPAAQQWTALVVFLLVFQAGQLLLVGAYAASRQRAARLLARFHDWLLPRLRQASVVLGTVVGALFVVLGLRLLAS